MNDSARPRRLRRVYSKVPSGPQNVFSLVLKLGGSPTGGRPGTTTVPLGTLPPRLTTWKPKPYTMEFRLPSCTFTTTFSWFWSVIGRLGATSAQSKTPRLYKWLSELNRAFWLSGSSGVDLELLVDDGLLRVLSSVGDDGRGCDLRTLADLVHHIHVVRIARHRLGRRMESRVQVSQRQVARHDLVAIFGNQVLRIGLARTEIQAMRRKLRLRQCVVAFDPQVLHHVQRAFGDLEGNVHVSVLANDSGNDLRLAVSGRAIGVPKVLHAGAHQRLAVLAVREQMSLLHADVRLQLLAAEVMVPFERNLVHLVASVLVDVVHDGHPGLVLHAS